MFAACLSVLRYIFLSIVLIVGNADSSGYISKCSDCCWLSPPAGKSMACDGHGECIVMWLSGDHSYPLIPIAYQYRSVIFFQYKISHFTLDSNVCIDLFFLFRLISSSYTDWLAEREKYIEREVRRPSCLPVLCWDFILTYQHTAKLAVGTTSEQIHPQQHFLYLPLPPWVRPCN